jgi:transcriptional regulator with XRE-family HTH domain
MTLSQTIAFARECSGHSLRALEKETGISNALLSQIERGDVKNPSFKTVIKISQALGISLKRLSECEDVV